MKKLVSVQYTIFNYVVTTGKLQMHHRKTLENLKSVLLCTNHFNSLIFDSFIFDFQLSIHKNDIIFLIHKNKTTTLENIIDLIRKRKIIIADNEIHKLIIYTDKIHPHLSSLFDPLR
jgi:hypothetical protein